MGSKTPSANNKFVPGTLADHMEMLEQHVALHPDSYSGRSMLLAMQHCTNAMMLAQFADELGYTPALNELHYAYLFDEKVYCDPH